MKSIYYVYLNIIVFLLIILSGCNCENRQAIDLYRTIEKANQSERFRFALDNTQIHHYEKELLAVAKIEIHKTDYKSQHVAICVLFSIVEPDQEDPPKAFLVSDLEARFHELYAIYGQDNEVGIIAEKFLVECFEEGKYEYGGARDN